MQKLSCILLCIFFFAAACKKDEFPHDTIGKPELTSVFTWKGVNYELSAGKMNLVQRSYYDTLGTGINLHGILSNPNCQECGPSFQFTVQSPVDYILESTNNLFEDLNQWEYTFDFDSTGNSGIRMVSSLMPLSAGTWFLNGNLLSPTPIDSNYFEITTPGNYFLAAVSNLGGCYDTLNRSFSYDGQSPPCYANLVYEPPLFTAYVGSSIDSATYRWMYNDTIVETSWPIYNLDADSLNVDYLCVEVLNDAGCIASACVSISNSPDCPTGIWLDYLGTFNLSQDGIARVIIEFTDENGITYSSNGIGENSTEISIISIEQYTESTMPDKNFAKFTFQISGLLFDSLGVGYPFDGIVVTAFEYPS